MFKCSDGFLTKPVMLLLLIVSGFVVSSAVLAEEGTLSDFEEPYRETSSTSTSDTDPFEEFVVDLAGEFLFAVGRGVNNAMVPDEGRLYQPTPYGNPEEPAWKSALERVHPSPYRSYSATTQATLYHVSDDVSGGGVDLGIRFAPGFSVGGSVTEYTEDLDGGGEDELTHWDAHLSSDWSLTSNVMLSPGIGGAGLNGDESHVGPSYGASLEWLPGQPVVITGSFYHSVISGADLLDYRSRIHVNYKMIDFSAGYRSLRNAEGTDLSGPTLGIKLWF